MITETTDKQMSAAVAETSKILKGMNPYQRRVFNTSLGKALENVTRSEERYPQIVRILQRLNHESRNTNL
jgi:precorrin-6x reductase